MRKWIVVGLALGALGCSKKTPPQKLETELPRTPPPAVDEAALDRSVNPCDDFYRFACGGWIAKTEIPADRPGWFRGFSEIQERNQLLLRKILEDARAGKLDSPYAEKLGRFYDSCMDEEAIEATGRDTLAAKIEAIRSIEGHDALAAKVAELQLQGVNAFFRFGSVQDYRNTTQVIGGADQGGLGLPDRDYYLKPDERSAEIRAMYVDHIATMFALAGMSEEEARAGATQVMAIETALAEASLPRVARRDPYKIYHRLDRKGLEALTPSFAWNEYFQTLGQPNLQPINVATPDFFKGLDTVLQHTDPATLQTYLIWKTIDAAAPALPEAFVAQDFRFRSRALTGEEQILPRWKRCVSAVDSAMGEALARPFVALTFGQTGKVESQELIRGIEEAFAANLEQLDWMDDATKKAAFAKLQAVNNKIGYPDKWRSYDQLEVGDSYLENVFRSDAFESQYDLNKIGKPVDPTEWFMSPPTVNAYYSPLRNEMVFPAGILQTPFFSSLATFAANSGGIGMVMGHELTHGFDDKGRLFDAHGNLREWWTPEVSKAYESKAQCVINQYEGYEVLGLHLNGKLTLGENIADIGGLKLSWEAFRARRAEQGPEPEAAGFTDEQQFFLSFAQSWCAKRRDEYARMLVTVDPHSPPEFRVNGVVANLPAFQEVFQCEDGSPMAPVDRCEVW